MNHHPITHPVEPPPGMVILGFGGDFLRMGHENEIEFSRLDHSPDHLESGRWNEFGLSGQSPNIIYAAPADSNIARINVGLVQFYNSPMQTVQTFRPISRSPVPPAGFVIVGLGMAFQKPHTGISRGITRQERGASWDTPGPRIGDDNSLVYAVPADSETARLNPDAIAFYNTVQTRPNRGRVESERFDYNQPHLVELREHRLGSIPAGSVFLGRGQKFETNGNFVGRWWQPGGGIREQGMGQIGNRLDRLYFAPASQHVVALNYDAPHTLTRQVHPWIADPGEDYDILGWGCQEILSIREANGSSIRGKYMRSEDLAWNSLSGVAGNAPDYIYAIRKDDSFHHTYLPFILRVRAEMELLSELCKP